jgi:phosphoglycolate phosphatase/pyrophosphatase PpaX
MLRYKCLALDHDDTVVRSEKTINYPCFCRFLEQYRPDEVYSFADYVRDCSRMPFVEMCKTRFSMTDEELDQEYRFWKAYMKNHIPDAFPGIGDLLKNYRNAGGKICVVSMSSNENILRDYRAHFGFEPDLIFGCDLPEELRKPASYPLEQIKQYYGVNADEILVVDDMKFAVNMARSAGCPIAFAGWSRKNFSAICDEMETISDYSFYRVEDLGEFLFK